MVRGLTVSATPAHVGVRLPAGVLALEADTGFVRSAVSVAGALCVATAVRVAQEILRAAALGAVVTGLTVSIFSADSLLTGCDAAIALSVTFLCLSACLVAVTFVPAARQGVPDVGWLTLANRSVVFANCTVSVGSAGSADLVTSEPATVPEWVSRSSPGTPTDGHVVPHSAVSPLATRNAARVHAFVVLASLLGGAVGVLVTLTLDAPGVRVSLVTHKTFTDWPSPHIPALCPSSAYSGHTGVRPAPGAAVRTSHVAAQARAHAALSATAALGIGTAQVSASARVTPARNVRISDV